MEGRISEVTSELSRLETEAKQQFGGLSPEALNWKADPDRWSIGQCFDHLIKMNSLYFPLFEKLGSGEKRPSLWERFSPFSGLFGRLIIHFMRPENRKKMKTTPKVYPSSSNIDSGIIDRFQDNQEQMIRYIKDFPSDLDLQKTIITSPLFSLVTYSLDDCLTLGVVHEQRHFQQAREVMEMKEFPN